MHLETRLAPIQELRCRGDQVGSCDYIIVIRGCMRSLQKTLYAVRRELLCLEGGVGERIIKGGGEVHAREQATGYFGLRHCHLEGEGDAIHLSTGLLVPEPIDTVPFLEVRPKMLLAYKAQDSGRRWLCFCLHEYQQLTHQLLMPLEAGEALDVRDPVTDALGLSAGRQASEGAYKVPQQRIFTAVVGVRYVAEDELLEGWQVVPVRRRQVGGQKLAKPTTRERGGGMVKI